MPNERDIPRTLSSVTVVRDTADQGVSVWSLTAPSPPTVMVNAELRSPEPPPWRLNFYLAPQRRQPLSRCAAEAHHAEHWCPSPDGGVNGLVRH